VQAFTTLAPASRGSKTVLTQFEKTKHMKKIALLSVAALMIGGITLTSCKKYEEGPAISLLTKKMRVAGDWEVESYWENGVDKTSDYRQGVTSETYTYDKEGGYTISITTIIGTINDAGTWEFITDKEEIKTQSNQSGSDPDTMVIVRLKNKEMWVKDKGQSVVHEYHMIAK
jgi:hypothetical protein